jgi:hypothetical protein
VVRRQAAEFPEVIAVLHRAARHADHRDALSEHAVSEAGSVMGGEGGHDEDPNVSGIPARSHPQRRRTGADRCWPRRRLSGGYGVTAMATGKDPTLIVIAGVRRAPACEAGRGGQKPRRQGLDTPPGPC